MNLSDIHEYASEISSTYKFDHCSVAIVENRNDQNGLLVLTETESSRDINKRYVDNKVYNFDPFMDRNHEENLNNGEDIFNMMTPFSEDGDNNSRFFWEFMTQNSMVEACAIRRRIGLNIDIVIGLHRCKKLAVHAVNQNALRISLSKYQNIISRYLLNHSVHNLHGMTFFNPKPQQMRPHGKLSPQEIRIALLIKEGKRNKEIAHILNITENTVEGHLRNAFRKLKVNNRTSLISALHSRKPSIPTGFPGMESLRHASHDLN